MSIGINLIFNILRNVANIIFPLITAPYIARILSPENLGLANFANSYASYFVIVAALGIPNYGIREVAKRKENKQTLSLIFSELFSINIFTTILSSLLYIITLYSVNQLNSDYIIFLVAGITLFTSPFNVDWYFAGIEEFQYITIRSLIIKTICIICLFLFVHNDKDLITYVFINSFSGCLNQFWNFIALHKKGINIKIVTSGLKKHLKPLLLLFSSVIAVSLYTTLNILMLGFFSTYDQVSFYNQANHIAKAFLAVITSLSEIMVPKMSYYSKNLNWEIINDLIKKSFSIVSFIAIPIAIGIIIIAPIFIPLFLGSNFEGSIRPLQIMSLITVIIGFNNITTVQILLGMGYDSLLLKSVLCGAGTNIILNILLIPWLGAIGAAISSVLAEVIILIVSSIFVSQKTKIKITTTSDLIKSLLGTIPFIPLFYILNILFDDWILIINYIILCVFIYAVSQFTLKSNSYKMIYNFIISKVKRN